MGGAGGGRDSSPIVPDHRPSEESENLDSPLRYKLAPPKPSDFDLPRGPVMTLHHEIEAHEGQQIEIFEASDQYVLPPAPRFCLSRNFRSPL